MAMRYGLFLLICLMLSACNNGDDGMLSTPDELSGDVVELIVTPKVDQTPLGFSIQYQANALFSNGRVLDVTNYSALTWYSSNDAVASIDSSGNATGLSVGNVSISASGIANGQTLTDEASLEITDAEVTSLQVTPESSEVSIGLSQQLIATAYFSDGDSLDVTNDAVLSWSSSDTDIASVVSSESSGNGLATGLSAGTIFISASGTANGQTFTDVATLEVNNAVVTALEISPETSEVPIGLSQQFTATATFSNGSTLDVTNEAALSWSSSDTGDATITSSQVTGNGLATGVSIGTVMITASGAANGQTFTDVATLDVIDAVVTDLEITPLTAQVPIGLSQQFTATATFSNGDTLDVTNEAAASWSSSDSDIATVASSQVSGNGAATGVTSGDVDISVYGVANGTSFSDTASLEVLAATSSQLFGEENEVDVAGNYLIGASGNLSFRCGSIVDAIGTPEGGLVGGTGGTAYTVSAADIVRVDVDWGDFTYDQSADVTISKIVLEYSDTTTFTCGANSNTSDIQTDYWTVPDGEEFFGFHVTSSAYAHSLRIISITN
jgi:hypothetical protein